MCDPISIGLMVAGTAMQGIAQGQIASKQKHSIQDAGKDYEAERAAQAGYRAENQKTFGDTLANYSRPNYDAVNQAATDQRQADYTSPLAAKNFMVAGPADNAPNTAVSRRNAATADAAKDYSLKQAIAKASLDAYGDTQTKLNLAAANNANKIGTVNRIAGSSEQAAAIRQNALKSQLEADKSAGSFLGGLGDLFTLGGSLAGMGGGGGGFTGVNQWAARNGLDFLSNGVKYISPFAGMPNSGVYSAPLAPIG